MKPFFTLIAMLGISLIPSGCETTNSSSASKQKEQIYLRKGMAGEEIKRLLGEPLKIEKKEGTLETWTYEDSRQFTRQVQADTREVPYINPISREETTITEVVSKLKTDYITLTTELVMLDGKLLGWKESRKESTDWNDRE